VNHSDQRPEDHAFDDEVLAHHLLNDGK
jgi:hypothetical protein